MSDDARTGLLVADVQKDFCAGGALAVPGADRVVSAMNRYIDEAVTRGVTVYAVRDWHPPDTTHFRTHGGPWPVHCVRDSEGARFHPELRLPATAVIVSKGEDAASPGYSAFEGHTPAGLTLLDDLRRRRIEHLYVGGVATDYCVRRSALDALSAGLQVTVLADAIAGIDADASAVAVLEMRQAGARVARGPHLPALDVAQGTWEHFPHGADIGVRGTGPTIAAAFEQAALALTAVITDPASVRPEQAVSIACEAPGDDLLLVDWLNALVYEMATRRMLFGQFAVAIEGSRLRGSARGEPVDTSRHEPAVEVKGATYTALRVERLEDGRWLAQCVVDV